ncbi:putative peroxiredoxin bcp [mine drainage metagenome]|uniref:thioredoxin-dependent peroxiredoxin n=1 Tax=mine drainage metagenome TaxID=410659 RepID=A0A1J5U6H1_9ZZZZ
MKWLVLFGLMATMALLASQMARAGELPKVGEAAPGFELPDQNGVKHDLKEYSGKWLVLYFYPRDDTPGCTQEACSFRDDLHKLTALGAQVVGISVDDSDSHAEFAKKYHLPFPLLADKSTEVAARYGALMNLGLVKFARRYTFLIDPQGKVAKVYESVETSRHSTEVIEDLARLTAKGA